MQSVNIDLLAQVIESQHGAKGVFHQSVRVSKWNGNPSSWDGMVHVFNISGHHTARRAFAWSSPIAGSSQGSRYFAVLQGGRIKTPHDAAKAAAAAIHDFGAPPPPRHDSPAVIINPLLLSG